MYKLVVLPLLFAAVSAGYLGTPLGYGAYGGYGGYGGYGLAAAPLAYAHAPVIAAPIVKAHVPVATSYANVNKVSVSYPIVKAAPIVAAPIVKTAVLPAAPLAYGYGAPALLKAPLAYGYGGLGYGYGGLLH